MDDQLALLMGAVLIGDERTAKSASHDLSEGSVNELAHLAVVLLRTVEGSDELARELLIQLAAGP